MPPPGSSVACGPAGHLFEEAFGGTQVFGDIEVVAVDHGLHGASFDEAHAHGREAFGSDAAEPHRIAGEDGVGQGAEGFAVAAELIAHARPDDAVANAGAPELEGEAGAL